MLLFGAMQTGMAAQQCQPLSVPERSQLEGFVEKWYHIPEDQHVTLVDGTTDQACYQKLLFRASFSAPVLVLYLTPDKTRLVASVMNLDVDPAVAQKKARDEMAARLASGAVLTSGPSNGPVTLVVFSDFECPYCRLFAGILAALRPEERSQLKIVYRQLPLSIHPWAIDAAQISTCAALQNKDAFWKLHDFYFENQETLSKETILIKSRDLLNQSKVADSNKLNACIAKQRFQAVLEQDKTLATDLGIDRTPTLFLNGRLVIVRSVDDLRAAIQVEARPMQRSATAADPPAPVHTPVCNRGECRK